jgi:hypothetical protein
MSEHATDSSVSRWQNLLLVPNTRSDELYDQDQGIKQHILRAFGFHDEYLSYSSNPSTMTRSRLKGEGHNWSSVSRVSKALRGVENIKLIHWNYSEFKNQSRQQEATGAFVTHARGIFVDRVRGMFIVYEPNTYRGQVNQWFGASLNDFAKQYKGFVCTLAYGCQDTTSDCEKRVIRFGRCCWEQFRVSELATPATSCPCGLHLTCVKPLYIRK